MVHPYYLVNTYFGMCIEKSLLPSFDWSTLGVAGGGDGEGIAILCSSDIVALLIEEL